MHLVIEIEIVEMIETIAVKMTEVILEAVDIGTNVLMTLTLDLHHQTHPKVNTVEVEADITEMKHRGIVQSHKLVIG